MHWAFSCLQAVIPAVSFAWNSLPLVLSVVGWLLSFRSPFRCHLHPSVVALVTHSIPAFFSLSPQSRNHHVDTFAWLLFACWPPCRQGPRRHHSLLFSGKIRSQVSICQMKEWTPLKMKHCGCHSDLPPWELRKLWHGRVYHSPVMGLGRSF